MISQQLAQCNSDLKTQTVSSAAGVQIASQITFINLLFLQNNIPITIPTQNYYTYVQTNLANILTQTFNLISVLNFGVQGQIVSSPYNSFIQLPSTNDNTDLIINWVC